MTVILLSPDDNVAIANGLISVGQALPGGALADVDIEPGHKVALRRIDVGSPVVKYGQVIGRAISTIEPGQHVHSQNLVFDKSKVLGVSNSAPLEPSCADRQRTFMGYRRESGRVGTRNYIGVISSVNCSSTVCRMVADEANRTLLSKYPHLDGFVPIVHDQGCGMSSSGDGMRILHRTLAGYARHSNFAGVLMMGLGCEVNQLTLYGQRGTAASRRHFNIQEVGGSRRAVELAVAALGELAEDLGHLKREPIPVSELVLGLQCGGSDGMSGITANPALGAAVDLLVGAGGTAILSETPEIYGAEHLLISRAECNDVADKLLNIIKWWEAYASDHGASLDNNPSPGNKRGGLTTILEKSLGAISKAGKTPLRDVLGYAERVTKHGLVFMDTPGYDPVSATGQIAGGANLIAFTTGRGSCFGSRPTPSIKLASNSRLYRSMEEDMDIDCGVVASGEKSIPEMGRDIFELLIATASGQKTKSELFGYGDSEFVPWHVGATL